MNWEELSHFTWEELKDTSWEDIYKDKLELLKKYEQSKIPLTKEALDKLNEICGKSPKKINIKNCITLGALISLFKWIIENYPNSKEFISDVYNLILSHIAKIK